MKRLIFLLCLIPLSTFGNTKEEQYICEFNTEVIIGYSTSEKPTPTVKKSMKNIPSSSTEGMEVISILVTV